jgi:uncharacterized cofD-like protein
LLAIGGGSGLPVLLRGLKGLLPDSLQNELTAIVTVADDGGSSGRLRREFGVLPPGDIRNCLVALADDEALLSRLFQHRFDAGTGLSGHSFGNLFLSSLTTITGDFYQAILTAESILSVRGRILPATLQDVHLRALGVSGQVYEGESAIGSCGERVQKLCIEPSDVMPFEPAVEAIAKADLIVVGPGSLYTSLLPNLLIPAIRRAVLLSPAPVVLVLNLMTQPGETDFLSAADHLDAFIQHADRDLVDILLINSTPHCQPLLRRYAESGSALVAVDKKGLEDRGVQVVQADLLAEGELIRHDSSKLAAAVLTLLQSRQESLR